MHIIELKDGGASLEFSSSEASAVSRALNGLRAKRTERGAVHDVYTIGKDRLIHYFEWDDPCIIAKTSTGSKLLRQMFAELSHSKAA